MRFRYRPFQALVIAVLAALITACAAFAPLYDRAMQQALTAVALENAPPTNDGLRLSAVGGRSGQGAFGLHNEVPPPTPEAVFAKVPEGVRASFLPPVLGYAATALDVPGGPADPRGEIVWRDGACDHVTMTSGACPAAAGEVAVSEADAENFGLEVGSTVRVYGRPPDFGGGRPPEPRLTVTGVYRQDASDYWQGRLLTGRSGLADPVPPSHVQHDVWLTDRATFEGGGVAPLSERSSFVDLAVDPDAVGVDELLELGATVDRLSAQPRMRGQDATLTVFSGLPDLADDVRQQRGQSRVTVPLLMAQLGLLAVVVLWLVLLAVTEQRRPEVALARLRGRGQRGAHGLLLGELLPLVLAGVLPGVVLAVGGAWLARTVVLPGSAPFELRGPLLLAVLLAVALLVLVTVVAVVRVAREPVVTLLRRVPPRRAGWGLGVAEALIIAGCGSVVVLFATGGLDGPVALAAPGLLAIVVGLVLAHLTTPTAALLGRRLLRRGRVRAGVSVLDAARSPATRRVVAIVTLATALAVFSADALLVGERNRATASEQQAGAPMVAEVRTSDLGAVRAALEDVDPEGLETTPVVRVVPPSNQARSTLAVLPDQFSRIALFPGGGPSDAVWGRLAAPDVPPLELSGSRVQLTVTASTLRSRRVGGDRQPVELGLDIVRSTGEVLQVQLGELPGPATRSELGTDLSCRDGCYVTGITFGTLPGATLDGTATLGPLRTDAGRFPLGPAGYWTNVDEPGGSVEVRGTGEDLTVTVDGRGSELLTLPHSWLPTHLSALVSGDLSRGVTTDDFTLIGVDGEEQAAVVAGTVPRLPASGPDTSLVNLDLAERGREIGVTDQLEVWFADDDDAVLDDVSAALADRGVALGAVTRLADVRQGYDESAAAWSLELAALVGAAALLIALLVQLVTALSSWGSRTRDLAALRMAGVPRRSIGSMAMAAQLPAVVVGVVAGTAAGLYGAQLALPIVPLFAEDPQVSTLDLDTAWGPVLLAAVAALVVLGLGAVLIGRALARRSDLRRLREGAL